MPGGDVGVGQAEAAPAARGDTEAEAVDVATGVVVAGTVLARAGRARRDEER